MPIETLICQHNGHEWTRERAKGRKPLRCPAHRAIQAQDDAGENFEIDLERVERVDTFRTWIKADSTYYAVPAEFREGKAPLMPTLPSKKDYEHAHAFEAL